MKIQDIMNEDFDLDNFENNTKSELSLEEIQDIITPAELRAYKLIINKKLNPAMLDSMSDNLQNALEGLIAYGLLTDEYQLSKLGLQYRSLASSNSKDFMDASNKVQKIVKNKVDTRDVPVELDSTDSMDLDDSDDDDTENINSNRKNSGFDNFDDSDITDDGDYNWK